MIKSGDQVILIGGENKINGQQIKNIEARDQQTRNDKSLDQLAIQALYVDLPSKCTISEVEEHLGLPSIKYFLAQLVLI